MDNALYVGLSRQMTLRRELDIVANNIANANTTGFKVEDLMVRTEQAKPAKTLDGSAPVKFVLDSGVARDFTQGPMTKTGGDFDLAIEGKGFFRVQTAGGDRYALRARLDGRHARTSFLQRMPGARPRSLRRSLPCSIHRSLPRWTSPLDRP